MRGCLLYLVLLAIGGLLAAWFLLPPFAAILISTGLTMAGVQSSALSVSVDSAPPYEIAAGHADRVAIQARDARVHEARIGRLDLELRNVSLLDRRFEQINGQLEDVEVGPPGARVGIPEVTVTGDDRRARAVLSFGPDDVRALVSSAIVRAVGVPPEEVFLNAPDEVVVKALGQRFTARLVLDDTGSLLLRPPATVPLGTVTLYEASAEDPFRLRDFTIRGGGLTLDADLSVARLLP